METSCRSQRVAQQTLSVDCLNLTATDDYPNNHSILHSQRSAGKFLNDTMHRRRRRNAHRRNLVDQNGPWKLSLDTSIHRGTDPSPVNCCSFSRPLRETRVTLEAMEGVRCHFVRHFAKRASVSG